MNTDDLMPGKKAARTAPLTDDERLIVQNFFDTQPAKRKAYMKQLGFELDPKDDNKYRPLGSDLPFQAEIDPGISAYLKKGGLKELSRDMGDISWDTLVQGPLTMAPAAKVGAAAGGAGAALGPAGAVVAGITGAILGGAAGNVASEELKAIAGDLILDEAIPQDRKLQAVQSLIVGTAPKIFQGGAALAKGGYRMMLESTKKAIVNAATSAGGGVTVEILEKAAKNPENFSKEAVEGASGKLANLYKEIFGTSTTKPKSTRNLTEGIFREKADALNRAANAEIDALAVNPQADFTIGELAKPMRGMIHKLADKFSRTQDEDAALAYLRNKLTYLEKEGVKAHEKRFGKSLAEGVTAPIDQYRIDFKQGREFLKSVQSDAFDKEVPGANFLRSVAGGNEDAFRAIADKKASSLGSKLPEINAQRSQLLQTYKAAQEALTPQNLTSAFIGDDSPRKVQIRDVTAEMDKLLGTNYSQAIENGAIQRVVENMYSNPKPFGSGRVLAEALKGGAKGAITGAGAGAGVGALTGIGVGVGAATGAVIGGAKGASTAASLAAPEKAISAIGSLSNRLAPGGKLVSEGTALGLEGLGRLSALEATGEAARSMKEAPSLFNEANASQQVDDFSDLMPPGESSSVSIDLDDLMPR